MYRQLIYSKTIFTLIPNSKSIFTLHRKSLFIELTALLPHNPPYIKSTHSPPYIKSTHSPPYIQSTHNPTCIQSRHKSYRYPYNKRPHYPVPISIEIKTQESSDKLIKSLDKKELTLLIRSLQKRHHNIITPTKIPHVSKDIEIPTEHQLLIFAVQAALPFIVFGFFDNAIMITLGGYIDSLLSKVIIGVSTITAAALGNIIADMFSVAIADRVENLFGKIGLPVSNITPAQAKLKRTRNYVFCGRFLGIFVGCVLGMFPILCQNIFNDPTDTLQNINSEINEL